ncbi:MAG: DNA polymerase I [Clostridia bacterium]|nr:DNA polymerase I [Clostridia bacterium]
MMKKILVIDGNSIINRAYYGVRPLTTKSGKNTNAIFGMINIITRQLERVKPDYAAVAFDLKAPTFRHKMYPEYKAGRHPTPEDLLSQFADAKECLSLMGIHVLELEGYEADDIQGTVALFAHGAKDTESYILSGDRDLLQLIDDKISVLLATNSDTLLMKRDEFFAKYAIEPSEFIDMKALMGDSSDNIPGVGGVGEKTAAQLIQSFKSLDGIYENIEDKRITKGVREKLLRDKDKAYLSKTLATIDTSVPLGFGLDALEYRGFDRRGLYKKFTELELNSFITRFSLEDEGCAECVEEAEKLTEIGARELVLGAGERIALIKAPEGVCAYNQNVGSVVYRGEISAISALFESKREIICFDGKRLWHELDECGVSVSDDVCLRDLSLYAYVINPGSGSTTLPSLYSMFLGKSVGDAPIPSLLWELEAVMKKRIDEDGMTDILEKLELPLINVLASVEKAGFKIDVSGMKEFSEALSELSRDLADRIYFQAGGEFNINSPKQLADVLFVRLGLPIKSKKNKNGYSTDAETLEELRPYSPIIDDILEYRQVTKLNGTYASVFPEIVDTENRLHTEFKQAHTATGRLSSADPNLQNIPIKTKMGRQMRRYFVAKEGYALVDADYSQIELRLLAHISGDYNMSEAFRNGEDIHTETASAVFGVSEGDVTPEMRKKAKAVNFGIIYGIGGFSLAKDLGIGVQEATKYIKKYLMNYPSIDAYLENVVNEAKERGYTTTPMGRRRYIPELTSQNGNMRAFGKRVAMNAPIQGAAADIMKLAMINVHQRLTREKVDARIVMQVHDELIIEARECEVERCRKILAEEMEGAVSLSIPLTVEVTSGDNWLDQN